MSPPRNSIIGGFVTAPGIQNTQRFDTVRQTKIVSGKQGICITMTIQVQIFYTRQHLLFRLRAGKSRSFWTHWNVRCTVVTIFWSTVWYHCYSGVLMRGSRRRSKRPQQRAPARHDRSRTAKYCAQSLFCDSSNAHSSVSSIPLSHRSRRLHSSLFCSLHTALSALCHTLIIFFPARRLSCWSCVASNYSVTKRTKITHKHGSDDYRRRKYKIVRFSTYFSSLHSVPRENDNRFSCVTTSAMPDLNFLFPIVLNVGRPSGLLTNLFELLSEF